jgi:chemotaxis family two-component system response regulator PixG
MIRAVLIEVLFDLAQAMPVTYRINEENQLSTPLVLIDLNEAIAEVQQLCQSWQDGQLVKYSPNSAPVIKQPEELQKCTSSQMFQTLKQLLDGQRTLRDLAMLMKRDILQVTRSLFPYIQLDLVELITIPDLTIPGAPPDLKMQVIFPECKTSVIACVDDSPLICQTMESLLVAAGYRFVSVDEPLRAFATLLANKPDVIFLDLVMPNTNGYEICAQLRKVSYFRNTPILILTGNDGIVDRVRAKLIGASDFLSKPIDAGTVLSMIRKHLN